MDIAAHPNFAAFRAVLLDAPARELAAILYGPSWEDSLVETAQGWRTRRLPKAIYLAPLIEPILAGRLAHDGRSHRETRSGGWWAHAADRWHPVSLHTIARALHEAVNPILVEARDRRDKAQAEWKGLTAGFSDAHLTFAQYRRPVRDADLRVALLGALGAFVDSDAERTIGGVAAYLKDPERLPGFTLGDDAAEAVLRDHLDDVLDVEDWAPGQRITSRELVEAFERRGCTLPSRVLLRVAPRLFGPRRVNQGFRYFEIPDDLVEA